RGGGAAHLPAGGPLPVGAAARAGRRAPRAGRAPGLLHPAGPRPQRPARRPHHRLERLRARGGPALHRGGRALVGAARAHLRGGGRGAAHPRVGAGVRAGRPAPAALQRHRRLQLRRVPGAVLLGAAGGGGGLLGALAAPRPARPPALRLRPGPPRAARRLPQV
ncbi:Protein of unknown function, partial [Gryllus bimaculatus]